MVVKVGLRNKEEKEEKRQNQEGKYKKKYLPSIFSSCNALSVLSMTTDPALFLFVVCGCVHDLLMMDNKKNWVRKDT